MRTTLFTPKPDVTPSRLAWLRQLEQREQPRSRSNVACHCMRLGWTEWVDLNKSRDERLTEAGRKVLEMHRAWPAAAKPPLLTPSKENQ